MTKLRYAPNLSIEEQLEHHPRLIDELRRRAEAIAEEIQRDVPTAEQVEYVPGELTTDEIASRYSNVWVTRW